ncbi:MAG: response regulator [Desulfobacteraceae bacterium]|nr:response regulator [Desulfobacteraceae bacterium]MBU4001858.1 response regulator [Pseudomonadota bacterium]MBU4053767.1 response regulator [Pseudomonadota bacterium]
MTNKINVLMVDDEAQFRATTSKILIKKGFNTVIAASGEEALEVLKANPQDVIILDIMMPGMGGHEALAQIKKISPTTQVIMLTGHGGLASAKKSLEQGAFDYLSKPCDIDLLSAKINSAYDAAHKTEVKKEKTAGDIMIRVEDYTKISIDTTILEAIHELKKTFEGLVASSRFMETGHRSILVFNHSGKLAGTLSIVDLIAAIRPAYLSAPKPSMADSIQYSPMFWSGLFTRRALAMGSRKVSEIMSESPLRVDHNSNLMEVADLMFREKARRVIVTKNNEIVGILREQEMFFEISNILEKPVKE